MHDRFAINDIESLNLKSRVRERGIERERDYWFIGPFLECRDWCELIFYSASATEKQQIWRKEKKIYINFGREMVNLGNISRFLQNFGDYQS